MPQPSFLKAATGTGATATRAMISVTTCAYHLKESAEPHSSAVGARVGLSADDSVLSLSRLREKGEHPGRQ